jgi:hypothetical protein
VECARNELLGSTVEDAVNGLKFKFVSLSTVDSLGLQQPHGNTTDCGVSTIAIMNQRSLGQRVDTRFTQFQFFRKQHAMVIMMMGDPGTLLDLAAYSNKLALAPLDLPNLTAVKAGLAEMKVRNVQVINILTEQTDKTKWL